MYGIHAVLEGQVLDINLSGFGCRDSVVHRLPITGPRVAPCTKMLFTEEIIENAFKHVCKKRLKYSHNNDIWDLRLNWNKEKQELYEQLNNATYKFEPVRKITTESGTLEIWSSRDAIVLKALEIILGERFRPEISATCCHIKGNGGLKKAVRSVYNNINDFKYVMKTDVKKYYASLDHYVMFEIIGRYVTETQLLRPLYQYLKRIEYTDGYYREVEKGICRGCPISPLLGALYLKELDEAMERFDVFYIRYMDDWVIMAKNRWMLRRVVKRVNGILSGLKLKKADDKTFIGKIERGFDFLGYHFGPDGLSLAEKTVHNFAERLSLRCYASGQKRGSNCGYKEIGLDNMPHDMFSSVSDYIRRWLTWVNGGLRGISVNISSEIVTATA
jgi:hypothetical protein